jgi:hypothetical protein
MKISHLATLLSTQNLYFEADADSPTVTLEPLPGSDLVLVQKQGSPVFCSYGHALGEYFVHTQTLEACYNYRIQFQSSDTIVTKHS